jgi:hypothetical protein
VLAGDAMNELRRSATGSANERKGLMKDARLSLERMIEIVGSRPRPRS